MLPQQEYHLQRKADVAVEILMQTVIAAGFVVKHQWRGLCLPRLVTGLQERRMFARKSRSSFTQCFCPAIRNFSEVRIGAASELRHNFRQRVGEILVVADAEAITLHDDMAAKTAGVVVQANEGKAFLRRQNWIGYCIATPRQRITRPFPNPAFESFERWTEPAVFAELPGALESSHSATGRCANGIMNPSVPINLSGLNGQILL
ncbi:MAG TPA: hypothetical protein VIW93_14245 [Candidatus Acidoferrum sp.]